MFDHNDPERPDAPEPCYQTQSNEQLRYIAKRLAEDVADQKTLSWRYCGNTHIVSDYTVTGAMLDDETFARKLIAKSFADESTSTMVESKFNQVAEDMIYDHILTSEELPDGYSWSGF